jgi:AraC family transcriptional regulator
LIVTDLRDQIASAAGGEHCDEVHATADRFVSLSGFTIRHTVAAGCEFQPHAHSAFTLTTVLRGELNACVAGDEMLALAGQSILIGPGQTHAARSDEVEFVSVGIKPDLILELLHDIGLAPNTPEIVFREPLVSDETLSNLARAVRAESSRVQAGRAQMLDALIRQLVIHLSRAHLTVRRTSQVELSRAGPVDRRLRRAIEFVHDNFAADLSVEEIAAAAYLSEYHFARLFKQITGVTPGAYLSNVRIERARTLLAETQLPISEIAAGVGYQSQSHFNKVFKSVTGVTPRKYRECAVADHPA